MSGLIGPVVTGYPGIGLDEEHVRFKQPIGFELPQQRQRGIRGGEFFIVPQLVVDCGHLGERSGFFLQTVAIRFFLRILLGELLTLPEGALHGIGHPGGSRVGVLLADLWVNGYDRFPIGALSGRLWKLDRNVFKLQLVPCHPVVQATPRT